MLLCCCAVVLLCCCAVVLLCCCCHPACQCLYLRVAGVQDRALATGCQVTTMGPSTRTRIARLSSKGKLWSRGTPGANTWYGATARVFENDKSNRTCVRKVMPSGLFGGRGLDRGRKYQGELARNEQDWPGPLRGRRCFLLTASLRSRCRIRVIICCIILRDLGLLNW